MRLSQPSTTTFSSMIKSWRKDTITFWRLLTSGSTFQWWNSTTTTNGNKNRLWSTSSVSERCHQSRSTSSGSNSTIWWLKWDAKNPGRSTSRSEEAVFTRCLEKCLSKLNDFLIFLQKLYLFKLLFVNNEGQLKKQDFRVLRIRKQLKRFNLLQAAWILAQTDCAIRSA